MWKNKISIYLFLYFLSIWKHQAHAIRMFQNYFIMYIHYIEQHPKNIISIPILLDSV